MNERNVLTAIAVVWFFVLLLLAVPSQAHITATERGYLEQVHTALHGLLGASDGDSPSVPAPTPPESSKPAWRCYLDRYSDVRAAGPYTEQWALRHYNHPQWGGKVQGRKWQCDQAASEPANSGSKRFSHVNTDSKHVFGAAVVLCVGDRADSVTFAGRRLRLHGNLDHGRQVWATFGEKRFTGTVEIVMGGKTYTSSITDPSGMNKGDCWGQKG